MSWNEANEDDTHCQSRSDIGRRRSFSVFPAFGTSAWSRADLRAYAQAYSMILAVTLLLLFEDDAAMLACMFC